MYDKKLKRGKDGLYTRYVGQNQQGTPEKFRLGYDLAVAEERLRLIAALWSEIEAYYPPGFKPYWERDSLDAAKKIAKGGSPTLPKRDFEDDTKYVLRVAEISNLTGVPYEPAHPNNYQSEL